MKRSSIFLVVVLSWILVSGRQRVIADSPHGGSATVRGAVKLAGPVPKAKVISMAADPSCAKQHPSPMLSQEVVADAGGHLQNAIVFISEGLGETTFNPPSQPIVFNQKGCVYQPHVLAMQANQPLEVVNEDPTTHNIHPMPTANREWNKAELPGAKVEEAFPRQEIAIPVKCNIHPWMKGYVAVFKHPYFAVTGKDGSFELDNLPPGNYTIEVWHETLGTTTQHITVAGNETKNVDFVLKSM